MQDESPEPPQRRFHDSDDSVPALIESSRVGLRLAPVIEIDGRQFVLTEAAVVKLYCDINALASCYGWEPGHDRDDAFHPAGD